MDDGADLCVVKASRLSWVRWARPALLSKDGAVGRVLLVGGGLLGRPKAEGAAGEEVPGFQLPPDDEEDGVEYEGEVLFEPQPPGAEELVVPLRPVGVLVPPSDELRPDGVLLPE